MFFVKSGVNQSLIRRQPPGGVGGTPPCQGGVGGYPLWRGYPPSREGGGSDPRGRGPGPPGVGGGSESGPPGTPRTPTKVSFSLIYTYIYRRRPHFRSGSMILKHGRSEMIGPKYIFILLFCFSALFYVVVEVSP